MRGKELAFWAEVGKDPFELADRFYGYYGGTGGEPKVKRRVFKRKPRDQRKKIQNRPFSSIVKFAPL